MATTTSLVTAVNDALFNDMMTDNGTLTRIRDGQTMIGTAFGSLDIPVGATIDGIQIGMEGTAGSATHDADVGHWISVSNDGGTTFSTAQSITTGPWTLYPGSHAVETAGGTSELWGMTWNATTAADIQVRLAWSTSGGDAVYLDYLNVTITYTAIPAATTYPSAENFNLKNGTIVLKNGKMELKY